MKKCLLNGRGTHAETMLNKFQVLKAKPYMGKIMLFQIKTILVNNLALFSTKVLKTMVLSMSLDKSFSP